LCSAAPIVPEARIFSRLALNQRRLSPVEIK
jgi:hypothetical protein